MKTIGIVSCGRSDWSYYEPLLAQLTASPDFDVRLYLTGEHVGQLLEHVQIWTDRCRTTWVPGLLKDDTPGGIAASIGIGTQGFAASFRGFRPDILVVFGDRFDMLPAALAALPFNMTLAHIGGGEVTEGAIDDRIRPCLTQLSHIHLVSTLAAADRVGRLMHPDSEGVWVVGALSLDRVVTYKPVEFTANYLKEKPTLLVTVHPETTNVDKLEEQFSMVENAVEDTGMRAIWTLPNADTQAGIICRRLDWHRFKSKNIEVWGKSDESPDTYFTLMAGCVAMVGNSSSGIIEAASFGLPVVNIGDRQKGRERSGNVIDVPWDEEAILSGIKAATSPAVRAACSQKKNVYSTGKPACAEIEKIFRTIP